MPVEHQVLVLFAATKGYLDEVDLKRVAEYEREAISYFESECKSTMDELRAVNALDDSILSGLTEGLKAFNATFNA
jgi:F0F1-type ATP synthase alpha subunit